MTTIFASDLHLSQDAPATTNLFFEFLTAVAARSATLYLLGDIFEVWLGDDDDSEPHPAILDALRSFTEHGCRLYVMSGNRDFLLGENFAAATGARLLDEWHRLDLYGRATLLTHGDLLCTRDLQYQAFRKYVRDPQMQQGFLAQSLAERRQIAASTRSGTQASMLEKDEDIMDVEQTTVASKMDEYGVDQLIHGHTHRPADHEFESSTGTSCVRHVLGDWYGARPSILLATQQGIERTTAREFCAR